MADSPQNEGLLAGTAKSGGTAAGKVAAATGAAGNASQALPEGTYNAEYLGSGTFIIKKPKRKEAKQRQSRLKGRVRGARK